MCGTTDTAVKTSSLGHIERMRGTGSPVIYIIQHLSEKVNDIVLKLSASLAALALEV